ncbi:MAG: hypothetical protein GEV09_27945, partial [Pseudonocardiaceae bacterium]|nr:hypothetical protein [Pseudonocardiaceae bacterium]
MAMAASNTAGHTMTRTHQMTRDWLVTVNRTSTARAASFTTGKTVRSSLNVTLCSRSNNDATGQTVEKMT